MEYSKLLREAGSKFAPTPAENVKTTTETARRADEKPASTNLPAYATPRRFPPVMQSVPEGHSKTKKNPANPPCINLTVRNLDRHSTRVMLQEEFSEFGPCHVVRPKRDGQKATTFVKFEVLADAVKAKEAMHLKVLDGSEIRVGFARY